MDPIWHIGMGVAEFACESQRYLAAASQRYLAALVGSVADQECFAGCLDDLLGDVVELVDLADALDLGE